MKWAVATVFVCARETGCNGGPFFGEPDISVYLIR
jgi:hypothetical protein